MYIFLMINSFSVFAQEKSAKIKALDSYNDSLKKIIHNLYSSTTDSDKHLFNAQLLTTFEHVLKMEDSFTYPFDSIIGIGILNSPDQMLRIFNWNIPLANGTHEYYGFVYVKQIHVRKAGLFKKISTETYKIFPLNDVSASVKNADGYISDNNKWYGMLYYTIIPKKVKNKKVYYTLLGWDGNDKFSRKKMIDVLIFNNKGLPQFGAAIFNTSKGVKKRVVFEYDANCTMSLKYNKVKDSIIFDHLSPPQPQLEGQYQYYCTDFTYDGFGFKNGKWNYGEYVNATNEKNEKDNLYANPKNTKDAIKSNEIIKRKPKEKKE
jgi:hypothetical protein